MRCEDQRQRLSELVDGELGSAEQVALFAHLEGCADCRAFFETLVRVRNAAKRDHEAVLREADEVLPARLPVALRPAPRGADGARASWQERLAAWWRPVVPAPLALVLASLLLAVGIAIGAGVAARHEIARSAPDVETAKQAPGRTQVVYVCSLPEYVVMGEPVVPAGN